MKLPRKKKDKLKEKGYRPPPKGAGGGAEARRELEELKRKEPAEDENEGAQEGDSASDSDNK